MPLLLPLFSEFLYKAGSISRLPYFPELRRINPRQTFEDLVDLYQVASFTPILQGHEAKPFPSLLAIQSFQALD